MRSRRTAVLGGSGFIGRYVVKRLAARGDVVPVGCRNVDAAKFLRPMGDVGQVEPLNVALDDEVVLPAFLAGSGALVNCVGPTVKANARIYALAFKADFPGDFRLVRKPVH